MMYVLILTVILPATQYSSTRAITMTTTEFRTAEACDAAGQAVGKDVGKVAAVYYTCTPK